MESEIIREAFRLGNSAGVLVPKEWMGRKVAVKLIDKSITHEVIEFLNEKDLLKNTLGIFLSGSYSRSEETEKSDVDIIVVTDEINKLMKAGKYEITLITKEKLESNLAKNLYLYATIREAKAIMNDELLQKLKDLTSNFPSKKILNEINAMTKINEMTTKIDDELKKNVSDETMYSIILRLRELYLLECLKKNKTPTNKGFLELIMGVASEESYNSYLRIKNDKKSKEIITTKEAFALINEIKKRIKRLEHG